MAIVHIARIWGMHPADVDPRTQPPGRAKWFWWQMDVDGLVEKMTPTSTRR